MRKPMLVVALAVVLVPLLATLAAEGQLIQCKNVLPCTGSKGDDKILGRVGDGKKDEIISLGGDLVLANK